MMRPEPRFICVWSRKSARRLSRRVGADGVDAARRQVPLGDERATAHLGHRHEGLLAALPIDVGEAGVPVLEATHLLELLLDPPAHLHRVGEVLLDLLLGDLAVRMQQLDEPGDGLAHGLLVAPAQVRAEAEVALGVVGVAALAKLAEDLGQVVGHEAEVIGVGRVRGLLELPAWHVGVDAIVERRVHLLRHRIEEVRRPHDRLDVAVDVADEDDRALGRDDVPATAEGPVLHVALHDVDAVLVREADAGGLVERHHVPQRDQPALAGAQVHEHLRRRRLAARDEVAVRAELLVDEALAGAARPQLDGVVVLLDERQQPQHVVELAPLACSRDGSARSPWIASADRATGRG